eukprot:GHVH01000658.1.p1 GENE.GHVH01000658.1~~GHVH01000658.1.p1  ORF type:complete len:130 (+),score=6.97 GHVH01000658.1:626-1015(+)
MHADRRRVWTIWCDDSSYLIWYRLAARRRSGDTNHILGIEGFINGSSITARLSSPGSAWPGEMHVAGVELSAYKLNWLIWNKAFSRSFTLSFSRSLSSFNRRYSSRSPFPRAMFLTVCVYIGGHATNHL